MSRHLNIVPHTIYRVIPLFFFLAVGLVLFGCETLPLDPDDEFPPNTNLSLIVPAVVPPGIRVPYALVYTDVNPYTAGWQYVQVNTDDDAASVADVIVKRGRGSGQLTGLTADSLNVSVSSLAGTMLASQPVQVRDLPRKVLSGNVSGGDVHWGPDTVIVIHDEVAFSGVFELTIDPGTIILLGPNARLTTSYVTISALGTRSQPILFAAEDPAEPWGELDITGSHAYFNWVFFSGGGGDASRKFGHSDSQPVIRVVEGYAGLTNCFIIDNPGKAMGTSHASVDIDSSLISRCDTGGEHDYTVFAARHTWFTDMPNGDTTVVDDDNDALYLHHFEEHRSGSHITNCVFVTGKDDGIDQNGSAVSINGCIIEGFAHEGVATSNSEDVYVFDTLILDCEQGIEAGYGSPQVFVEYCTITDCDVGLRFGDNYPNQTHTGSLTVMNTISVYNRKHNVWNFDPATELPAEDAVSISWSLVNTPEYDSLSNNLSGVVEFDIDYRLLPGSPGTGGAISGTDMGITGDW